MHLFTYVDRYQQKMSFLRVLALAWTTASVTSDPVPGRTVSYWFAPLPCNEPPPPPPPRPAGCLANCSMTPPGACITGCTDKGPRTPCNGTFGGCNRCKCNALPGERKGSTCSPKSSRNLTLCPSPPVNCYPWRNATMALEWLGRQGGARIATTFFLY